jgi:hypothetical protein
MPKIIKISLLVLITIIIIDFIFIEFFVIINTNKKSNIPLADEILLPIRDIEDDPEKPKNIGWCGEASIQMACLYYGAYIPQGIINKMSNPSNPDLYYNDIPKTLELLNISSNSWYNQPNLFGVIILYLQSFWRGKSYNIQDYINWIKYELSLKNPIIIGVKIFPDKHPNWWIDHFMLAIGYNSEELIFNQTGQGTQRKSFEDLVRESDKYSFFNKYNYYYGYSIQGFNFNKDSDTPFLEIQEAIGDTIFIKIRARKPKAFLLHRYSKERIKGTLKLAEMEKEVIGTLSQENNYELVDKVPKKFITIYRLLQY